MKITFLRRYGPILSLITTICSLAFSAAAQGTISFGGSNLSGASSYLVTSIQFGPDNRLYVAQQDGIIKAYSISRLGPNNYIVTGTETILKVNEIPNHNDDGNPNPSINYRQITGIALYGSASNPEIWVTSSDPRIGAGPLGTDKNLDTNSGIVSKITWNGSSWDRVDLVRGLPRSEENHSLNGLVLDSINNILYVCAGGNTNMGARSNNFAMAPEYAYAAAILSIHLDQILSFPYDLPTLDDEDRPGVNDFNDPFGGNNGKNQAVLEVDGPVRIHASGFRNAYDIILAENGKMYSWDNGPNANWGGKPTTCLDVQVEGGNTYTDGLHLIPSAGYYGGHPNLTRANRANTFNATNPQSPVPVELENPIECNYLIPVLEDETIVLHGASTNGLAEYTASNFEGAMQGHLLAAAFDGKIVKVELNASGDGLGPAGKTTLFEGFGAVPLDVIAVGDDGPFPGTVWVGNIYGSTPISIFEPADYGGGIPPVCDFSDPDGDADGDGFTNYDELLNGTDPCSAASKPNDWDGDGISDLLDPDDDNDGIPDVSDKFALDPDNGLSTFMPIDYDWEPGDPGRGGFFELGFTGMMNNGNSDYLDQYEPDDITAGGTAGLFTIDAMTEGSAFSTLNNQDNAFQFGVNVDTVTRPFVLQSRIRSPFGGSTPADFQNMGMFFGTGDMSNYIKLVIHSNGGAGGLEYLQEVNDIVSPFPITKVYPAPVVGAAYVDLYLTIDPIAGTVQPSYSINGGFQVNLDGPRSFPLEWVEEVVAAGIIGTSNGPAPEFPATWDYIKMKPLGPVPSATLNAFAGNWLDSDLINTGSFTLTNTSANGGRITQVSIDLTELIQPDMVFDPFATAADNVGKDLSIDSGDSTTGFLGHYFEGEHDGGYDRLVLTFSDFDPEDVLTFSIDIDPTSIKGLNSPGPNQSSRVCGLELTGAKVEILFESGVQIGGQMYMTPSSFGGSRNRFDEDTLPVPSIAFLGDVISPSFTTTTNQTVRITGQPGANVKLLRAEGGLFLGGNPGFDIDSFESNSLVSRQEYSATIGLSGFVDVPVTLSLSNAQAGINHFVAVLNNGIKTSNLSNKLILQVGDDPGPIGGQTVVNLNCGGPAYVAQDGTEFAADQYFTVSNTYTNNTIPDILNTTDDPLYRTERSSTSFSYNIPLENGDYEVILHFAEIFFGAPGGGLPGPNRRVFNVNMEGVQRIANLDLFDSVGHSTALVMSFPVTVDDQQLNIAFQASINQGKISAIQVRPMGEPPVVCIVDSIQLGVQSDCDDEFITYSQVLTIFSSNAPDSGLVVVNGQSFAVSASPQTVVLEDLISDGQSVDLSIAYSADSLCVFALDSAWFAPEDCTPAPVCQVPSNLYAYPTSTKSLVDWDDVPGAVGYQIAGRRVGTTKFRFVLASESQRMIPGLTPGTDYEFMVRAACAGDTTEFSPLFQFTTLTAKMEAPTDDRSFSDVTLWPNPASDFAQLALSTIEDGPARLIIRDLSGRMLLISEHELMAGPSVISLQTNQLEGGFYLVELVQGNRSTVMRLEIIR